MAESCRNKPLVFNKQGEMVESQLYNDLIGLMSFVGKGERKTVLPLYEKTLDPKFKADMENSGAMFDENGEVSLYDYWRIFDNGREITEEMVLKFLNEKENFFNKTAKRIFQNKEELFEQVNKFNSNPLWSRAYIATIKSESKPGETPKFTAEIVLINDENKKLIHQYRTFMTNSGYMAKVLRSAGMSPDAYNRLESLATNGYTDFDDANNFFSELRKTLRVVKGKQKGNLKPMFATFVLDSMRESPLVTRAINVLITNDSYKDLLNNPDELNAYYNGDKRMLALIALGNVISGEVKNNNILNDNLILRIKNSMKNSFSSINEDGLVVENERRESVKNVKIKHEATKDLWDHFFAVTLRRQNIYSRRKRELGLTEEDEQAKESILTEQGDLLQTLDIAAHHDWSKPFIENDAENNPVAKTKEEFRINAAVQLIDVAIKDTERIKTIVKELDESIKNGTYRGSMNSACAKVRAIMDYLESYEQIFDNFDILLKESFDDPVLNSFPEIDNIRKQLREQANLLNESLKEIKNAVLPDNKNYDLSSQNQDKPLAFTIFLKGLSDFIPEGVGLACGTGVNGEVMTLEELLMYSDADITGISAWLNSMANTGDDIARMYDYIVKRQKDEARQECLEDIRRIKAAGKELDKAGFSAREHKWMYQHDKDGKLVLDNFGRPKYIVDYDMDAATKAFQKFNNSLYKKYARLPEADKQAAINKDRNEWLDEHFERRRGEWYPKASYFPSKSFNALSEEQKKFYNTFMDIKRKYDSYIPLNTNDSATAIIVRKGGLQKLLTLSKDYNFIDLIKDWYKDTFTRTATDDEFGTVSTIKNFNGQEVKKVPIYHNAVDKYTNLNNYSMNCVANLCLYVKTASNYKAMSKVVETLELGRDILAQRRTHKRNIFGKPLTEPIKDGEKILQEYVYLDQQSTNFNKRLDNFMDMHVYGKLNEGRYSKQASFFGRAIGTFTTAINLFVGITNVLQGIGQINIEMLAGEHIGIRDVLKANWIYFTNILPVIFETGSLNASSKLGLFSQDFNVMQDFEGSVKDMNQYEKNRLYRMGELFNLYILNHIGEHYMQHITAIALANRTKIYTSDDKAVSIWEAYESVPLDESDPKLGGKLQLKHYKNSKGVDSQTYYTEDGKQIVSMEQLKARQTAKSTRGKKIDLYSKRLLENDNEVSEYEFKGKLSRKMGKLNQDMHGIYNEDDRNRLQQKAYGGLFMMYRKHIVPNFMKRYKDEWYDYDLETKTSGYQRMLFTKMFKSQIDNIGRKKWAMLTWSPRERANLMRNVGQLSNWVLINLGISMMESFADDDDSMAWWYAVVLTSLYRAKTENAQFEPLAAFTRHTIFNEWWRLAEQPIVGFSIVERVSNLTELFDPECYTHVMKSGPYKGQKKWQKIVQQALPGFNQIRLAQKPPLDYFRKDVGEDWFSKGIFTDEWMWGAFAKD